MNVNHHQTKRERSYFEWGDNMQITRKGKGEIAMTESELVDFFSVTWRKLNYRLQLLLKVSPPATRRKGYRGAGSLRERTAARLCLALSAYYHHRFVLSIGQHGSILLQEIHLPRVTTSCICDGADIPIWKWQYQLICFSLSPILSYYRTTRKGNTVKGKGWYCSQKVGMVITTV